MKTYFLLLVILGLLILDCVCKKKYLKISKLFKFFFFNFLVRALFHGIMLNPSIRNENYRNFGQLFGLNFLVLLPISFLVGAFSCLIYIW